MCRVARGSCGTALDWLPDALRQPLQQTDAWLMAYGSDKN